VKTIGLFPFTTVVLFWRWPTWTTVAKGLMA
jgi:hypothetical protein